MEFDQGRPKTIKVESRKISWKSRPNRPVTIR